MFTSQLWPPCAVRGFFHDAFFAEQRANRIGRLSTVLNPADDFFFVDVDNGGVFGRVVIADDFDKATVTRRTAVRNDYAIERLPFGTHSIESDFYQDLTTFRVWLKILVDYLLKGNFEPREPSSPPKFGSVGILTLVFFPFLVFPFLPLAFFAACCC